MVVGTLLYGLVGHRLHRRTAVLVALGGTALPLIAMATLPTLPWMLGLGFLSGLLFGPVNPIINVVMQERSPERMRGRVLGVFTSSAYAAGPLGLLLVGPLVDHLGVQGTFMALALALTVVGLGTIALPGLRDLDRSTPELSRGGRVAAARRARSAGAGRATASQPTAPAHGPPRLPRPGTARRLPDRAGSGQPGEATQPWRVRRRLSVSLGPGWGRDTRTPLLTRPPPPGSSTCSGTAGVRTAFGLPGVHNLPFWRCSPGAGRPRILPVRHEQTAAYAADGLARATGGLGRRADHHRTRRGQRGRRLRRGVDGALSRAARRERGAAARATCRRRPRRAARDARPERAVRAAGQGRLQRHRSRRGGGDGRRCRRRWRGRLPPARSTSASPPTSSAPRPRPGRLSRAPARTAPDLRAVEAAVRHAQPLRARRDLGRRRVRRLRCRAGGDRPGLAAGCTGRHDVRGPRSARRRPPPARRRAPARTARVGAASPRPTCCSWWAASSTA